MWRNRESLRNGFFKSEVLVIRKCVARSVEKL
ncbi:hypothetical protein SHIRM173S_06742 [Streptomyces hirsutus]